MQLILSKIFASTQQLGRALMLPIAVLPVAGLLLRLGQQDLLNIQVMAQAGDAVFANLPLIFAIGVAIGFAKDNNGAAALAAAIGYLILSAVLKAMDPKINMGVLGGISSGISAALLYNRYKDIRLPSYLAFFGGKRFVPIVTGVAMLLSGMILGHVWPQFQHFIDSVGKWLINAGDAGLFVYGLLNRLLIVTGLHHILNSLVWFVFGTFTDPSGKEVAGDLHRFFAGDPAAGSFMTGFFPVMIFGLPAACLAMYRNALPDNRKAVGGVLFSMALTAAITGVTEPVEFSFMFLAPLLYGVHAILTGVSMALMNLLDVRLGFTFSAGLFDYLLSAGKGEHPLRLIPVGLAYFAIYYGMFSYCIKRFNLMTPGREPASASSATCAEVVHSGSRGELFINALGGAANLKSVDACTTRLRLEVADSSSINETKLKSLGSLGVVRPAPGSVQVVIGPEAEILADEIRASLGSAGSRSEKTAMNIDRSRWLAALGGEDNLLDISHVAVTRLRVVLKDSGNVNRQTLDELGVKGVMAIDGGVLHLLIGMNAQEYSDALRIA